MRTILYLLGGLLLGLLLGFPSVSIAELANCDGRWTNKECEGEVSNQVPEEPAKPQSAEAAARDRTELWLHDLDMLRLDAKRRYDITVSIEPIRDLCQSSSLDACRKAISEKEREINELVTERAKVEVERDRAVATGAKDQNIVNIQQNQEVIYVRPRRRPIYTYGAGGSSIAIGGSGTIGGSGVSGGVTVSSGASNVYVPPREDYPLGVRPPQVTPPTIVPSPRKHGSEGWIAQPKSH